MTPQELSAATGLSQQQLGELQALAAGRVLLVAFERLHAGQERPSAPHSEAEERFRAMADNAPVLVWQADAQGAVFMNTQYTCFLGRPQQQLLGMGWTEALHPEDADGYVSAYLDAFKQRQRFEAQFRFRRFDGEYRWLKSIGEPYYEADGRFVGYIGSSFDIADVKQAQEVLRQSQLWFERLADTAPTIVWVTDPGGRCTFLSRRWHEFTGQSPQHALGFGWLDAVHPQDRPAADARFRDALAQRGAFELDYRLRRADGSWRWCIDMGVPRIGTDGVFLGHVGNVIDITERKLAELTNADLSRALQGVDQRKNQFLATLAHELRNPLTPLRTGLHIVRTAPGSETAGKVLQIMERQVEHLVRLIDDLMDVSRIARQRLELRRRRLDLRTVVDSAAEANAGVFEARGQTLSVSCAPQPLWVEADDVRVAQVVSNLLVNASKYSPTGSEVELSLQCAAGSALIKVKDKGIGIAPQHLEAVFDMFASLDQQGGRIQSGLGIGLALTRRLVEMHGGRVWAESAGQDQGSSFFVELPLAQLQSPDAGPDPEAKDGRTPSAPPRRVLITDDNVDAAQTLATALAMAGHEVRTASDGEGALQAAASFLPEVVVLDIGMPGLSGYDVARRLRQEPSLSKAYLVALTGWGSWEDQQRALEAGFDVHVTKPASAEHIEHLITAAANRETAS
ncbi:hybrid sensor histidine kinase/response regulator [Azohydromonas australica]|uniref:hybrid sensor histidine kinase/response regulator n=1 Tax=Azohydromonas australica TaxID=364039 RepID=UPI00041A3C6C|nr:PAS domain-containing protein [Azohydromonas australica]